jgi:dinuclear metal center YbgI/SA1388 family protein
MLLNEILEFLEGLVPTSLQEDYDNSGLIIGNPDSEIHSALICLDINESILDEALSKGSNLVISHHPMVFQGMKKFTGRTMTERLVEKAIRNNIAVFALHTNLDNYSLGVNHWLCEKLEIQNPSILRPLEGKLRKLVTFCPLDYTANIREALFLAGAGHIGNYDSCSFSLQGNGTFRPLEGADPFIGTPGEIHTGNEDRIEVIYPVYIEKKVITALLNTHPYEEVAYDIYPLANTLTSSGAGMIGELESPADPIEYLSFVKKVLGLGCLKHTAFTLKKISKIAVCGGSGSFLIKDAIAAGAHLFMTGDIKYHDFFLPHQNMILGDIGHYESEQFTKELIYTLLMKKFPNFALLISKQDQNPINYL